MPKQPLPPKPGKAVVTTPAATPYPYEVSVAEDAAFLAAHSPRPAERYDQTDRDIRAEIAAIVKEWSYATMTALKLTNLKSLSVLSSDLEFLGRVINGTNTSVNLTRLVRCARGAEAKAREMRVYIPDLMALLLRVDTGAPSRAVAPRSAKDDVFVRIGGTNTFAQVQERVLPRDVVADALVAVEWHGELLILDITAPEPEALGPYGFEMLLEVGGIRRLVDGVGRQKRQLVYSFNGETFEIVEPVVAIGRVLAKVPCSGNSLPAETRT